MNPQTQNAAEQLGNSIGQAIGSALVGMVYFLFILFIIFLILRWFNCWYWKINKIVALLTSIDARLSNVEANRSPVQPLPPVSEKAPSAPPKPKAPAMTSTLDPKTGRYVIQ